MQSKISIANLGGLLGVAGSAAGIVCWAYVGIYTDDTPSSTAGIGYLFAPIAAALAGVVGGAIGFLAGATVQRIPAFGWTREIATHTAVIVVVSFTAVAGGLGGYRGYSQTRVYNALNSPRVLLSHGDIQKVDFESVGGAVAALNYAPLRARNTKHFSTRWFGQDLILLAEDAMIGWRATDGIYLVEAEAVDQTLFEYVLPAELPYVTHLQGLEVTLDAQNKPYYAFIVILRATSRRTVFFILSPIGELVYQELLENIYHIDSVASVNSAAEMIILSDRFGPLWAYTM